MPWIPDEPGEIPTLGHDIAEWIESYLVIPDGDRAGEPFRMTDWQYDFTLDLYALDPATGKRRNRRGAAILSKGIGKSPWAAALSICEFVGPVLFDGWDANGKPVGRPWATPHVQIAATNEDQTGNTYSSLFQMLTDSHRLLAEYPEIDAGRTRVYLLGNSSARIEAVTAESTGREGARATFAVLDETGLWRPNNGGVSLASVIRRNVAKQNGTTLETSNSYVPGEESVAERTFRYVQDMKEGKTKQDSGIVYLHKQAPPDTDLSDKDSLIAGLRVAYMDTPWIDYERLVAEIWDPATDPQDAKRFYLNMIVSGSDSWVTAQEWDRIASDDVLKPGEQIALGFDGAINDDSTALVASRVSDGHLFLLGCWEKPEGAAGDGWTVDREEVDATVRRAFATYDVSAFFADPPHWQDYIDRWTADLSKRLRVKASQTHPIEFWTNRNTAMVAALERIHTAIVGGDVLHPNSPTLTRHFLNAKRKMTTSGLVIRKDHKGSPHKIDAAMAAALAYEARSLCVSKNAKSRHGRVPVRIR